MNRARQKYTAAQAKVGAASTAYQNALLASYTKSQSSDDSPASQKSIARYHTELEPQLVKLRAQLLAISPDAASVSGPDYHVVNNERDLNAVCMDFMKVGLNAYMSEGQRLRNEHNQSTQTRGH